MPAQAWVGVGNNEYIQSLLAVCMLVCGGARVPPPVPRRTAFHAWLICMPAAAMKTETKQTRLPAALSLCYVRRPSCHAACTGTAQRVTPNNNGSVTTPQASVACRRLKTSHPCLGNTPCLVNGITAVPRKKNESTVTTTCPCLLLPCTPYTTLFFFCSLSHCLLREF